MWRRNNNGIRLIEICENYDFRILNGFYKQKRTLIYMASNDQTANVDSQNRK